MARPLRLLLAIAWRNLGRNRRRTLIAGGGIAVGVGMCIATYGVTDGMNDDMVRSITDVQVGHVQVHRKGFTERPKLDLALDDVASIAGAAERTPGVEVASPRVIGWALASSARDSAGIQLVGVDPAREAKVTRLDLRIEAGAYLDEAPVPWPKAERLSTEEKEIDRRLTEQESARAAAEIDALGGPGSPQEPAAAPLAAESKKLLAKVAPGPSRPPPLLVGYKLAKKLHAAPGALLVLTATDADGNPVNVSFQVAGILRTGDATLDAVRAVANLADAQRFFGMEGRAHEIALRVRDPARAPAIARALGVEAPLGGLDVKAWQDLRPDVVAMVQTNDAMTELMIAIIFAIAAIGVADAILMAVFE